MTPHNEPGPPVLELPEEGESAAARPPKPKLSWTRWAIRALLVVLIFFLPWLGYRLWLREKPDLYWTYAQAAQKLGQSQEAELYLRNSLRDYPDDVRVHRALAELYLQQGSAQGRKASYATDPRALYHLDQTARLSPEDLPLQKQLLGVYLSRRDLARAIPVASRVAQREPEYAAALLPLGWAAVRDRDPKRIDAWFGQLAARLATARPDTFRQNEAVMLAELLLAAVQRAPDQAAAERLATSALDAYQILATTKQMRAVGLANHAAQLMVSLRANWPPAAEPGWLEEGQPGADLDRRAERLRAAAITAGGAEPLVYHQSAAAAFARGDYDGGLATIRRGVAGANASRLPGAKPATADSASPPGVLDLHLLAVHQLMLLRRYAAAQEHLDVLISQPETAGWGHLLAGWVALAQGKAERASGHYAQAQNRLGFAPPVRMGLAVTQLALRQWEQALEQLQAVERAFPQLSPEDQAWAGHFFGPGIEGLHYYQLHAELAQGRWPQAEQRCRTLRGTRLETQAAAAVVSCFWAAGQREQALARLAEARQAHPREGGLVAVELALLEQQGETAEAQRRVEEFAATAPPGDLTSQLLLCRWRLRHGQAPQAWEQLHAAEMRLATSPARQAAVAAIKAEVLLALGKPDEAAALMEPLRSDARTAMAANLLAAAAHIRLKSPEQAAEALAQASRFRPDSVVLNHLQGELAASRRDYAQALECLTASLEVTGLRARAAAVLADVVRAMAPRQPVAELQSQVAQLLKRVPDEPQLLVVQAELHLQQGRLAAADELLERIARERPNDPLAAALAAAAWLRAGQTQRALQAAQQGLKLDPHHAACLLVAAQASLAAKQPQQAHDYAAAALEQKPQLVSAVLLRTQALQQLGRRDEAHRVLEDCTRSRPQCVEAYLAWGQSLTAARQVDQALEVYRRGSAALPGNLSLVTAEVNLLVRAGRLAEAKQVAKEAAKLGATSTLCLALAQAFDGGNEFDLAQALFRRALTMADEKQKSEAHLRLGMSLSRQHQGQANPAARAEARDHFAAALQADPTNLVAANNLAWLLATEFERPAEAVRVIEQARAGASIAQWPGTMVHTVAVVYRAGGRAADARQVLEESLALRPDQPKLLLELGSILADSRQPAEARVALERALKLGLPDGDTQRARRLLEQLDAPPPPPPSAAMSQR